jgi:hypothetical protein
VDICLVSIPNERCIIPSICGRWLSPVRGTCVPLVGAFVGVAVESACSPETGEFTLRPAPPPVSLAKDRVEEGRKANRRGRAEKPCGNAEAVVLAPGAARIGKNHATRRT